MDYSIVIPCYKSFQTIEKVVRLLQEKFANKLTQIILVNDGSPDGGETEKAIHKLTLEYDNVLGIYLAKNTGQHNAVLCGLNYANGDRIICMDDDLQTHPSQIDKLIAKMDEGYDIVYACYPEQKESWYRLLGSKFSSWSVRTLIGKPKWLKTSSFWIIKKFVRDSVIEYKNPYTFLPGLFLRTTDCIANVEVEHFKREVGQSGYDLKHLIKLWSNIIGFSVKPLRFVSIMGFAFSISSFLFAIAIVVRKLLFGISATGWASLIVAISFFSGAILLSIGLVGEYLGRLFISNSNQPQFVIKDIEGMITDPGSDDNDVCSK